MSPHARSKNRKNEKPVKTGPSKSDAQASDSDSPKTRIAKGTRSGNRRGASDQTSPTAIEVKRRSAEVLELRAKGLPYDEIATRVGFTDGSAAYKAVRRELAAITREPAEELLGLEVHRLDVLFQSLWEAAKTGDLETIEGARKLIMDRAKLLGLVTNKVQVEPPSREAMWERVRGWLSEPTPELVQVLEACGWKRCV